MSERIKIGVSACLMGHPVRYDGGHRRDAFIAGNLSQFVELVPVCPEVECGLPVPRETMRLEGSPESPRLMTTSTRQDLTDRMLSWCAVKLMELEKSGLRGFIFKKGSPSSGMANVKVYNNERLASTKGVGIFARAFMRRFPLLPVEEDERLYDPEVRENFIEAIFVLERFRDALDRRPATRSVVEFHDTHRLLLMAHSPKHLKVLDDMVASIEDHGPADFRAKYQQVLLAALKLKATRRKHFAVLSHTLKRLNPVLRPEEKEDIRETMFRYRQGILPLIVPVTLLGHYAGMYDRPLLKDQWYLTPDPAELRLRNHA